MQAEVAKSKFVIIGATSMRRFTYGVRKDATARAIAKPLRSDPRETMQQIASIDVADADSKPTRTSPRGIDGR